MHFRVRPVPQQKRDDSGELAYLASLIDAVRSVMSEGLSLLGIEAPEQM